jgi:hypothetical protein
VNKVKTNKSKNEFSLQSKDSLKNVEKRLITIKTLESETKND